MNGENPVLQGSFSWPSIPSRKTGILMIKTCGVINRNHYYYSDTGGITGIFSDNCYHCFLVPSSLIYLTFIRNIKSVPIIPPPSHPLPPLPPLTLRHREHWTRKLNSSQTQVFILLFFFWSQQPVLVRVIIDMGAFRWPHFWKFILAHLSAFKMIRGNSQL